MIPVTIQGLSKHFDQVVALDHIDLNIPAGELFFLLGPSGCGKTTLLRSIAGFCKPDSGRILFGNEEVTHQPPHQRNTGMMFQSYALWPHMNVEQNVAFGLEERRVARAEIRKRVDEALTSVQMLEFKERRIHQLSGGQQQRVALARALVVRPRCLLLDEPLSNLDARLRLDMRSEIKRICRQSQLTAIYVTHDQKEALSVADRIALFNQGRLCQQGTPRELYRRPATRFVADFIGETNFIPGTIREVSKCEATVETGFGLLTAAINPSENPVATGSRVEISIRPECWRLSPEAAAINCIEGRIRQSVYLGEIAQHEFEAPGGVLNVYELNPGQNDPGSHQPLFASVSPEDVVILSS